MGEQVILGSRSETARPGPELMETARSSVVRIKTELGGESLSHGTAFAYKQVIRESKSRIYFLTNLHNFTGPMKVFGHLLELAAMGAPDEKLLLRTSIEFRQQEFEVSQIIACKGALFARGYEHYQDFAFFAIDTEIAEPIDMFALPQSHDARPGETAYAFGYPTNTDLGITEGIISHVYGDHENHHFRWQIQHSIQINPGNSGGPTVSSNGVAIGMSTWGRTDVNAIEFSVNLAHTFELCRQSDAIEQISISGVWSRFVTRVREEVKYGS